MSRGGEIEASKELDTLTKNYSSHKNKLSKYREMGISHGFSNRNLFDLKDLFTIYFAILFMNIFFW